MKKKSIYINESLLERIEKEAELENRNFNNMLNVLIEEALKKRDILYQNN